MNEVVSYRRIRAQAEVTRAQMELVITEVSESVGSRADQTMQQARETARLLQEMAVASGPLIDSFRTTDQIGPEITVIYGAAECLAAFAEPFRGATRKFMDEHGVLVPSETVDRLEAFCTWAGELATTLRPAWQQYVADYERGLIEAADEQNEIADDWAAVDSDPWVDAASE